MQNKLSTEYNHSLAVVVGVNAYSNLSPLQGAANDAASVADVLRDEFGFASQHVFLLLDQYATRGEIIDRLEVVARMAQLDDRVVFFFAGHGASRTAVSGGVIGYVATVETEPHKWNTYLRIEDITRYSHLIPAKHVLYVFDSCFSGLALSRQADRGAQGAAVAET